MQGYGSALEFNCKGSENDGDENYSSASELFGR
jgi:hypothetical protein